jgi:phosphoglycolate phosphatase-like HAD superfamily hydrolase
MKKILLPLTALALITSGAHAQPTPPDFTPPPPPETLPPEPPMPPELEIPEEILDLHAEVKMLREELRESRRAVLEELGDEATRDEIAAALSAWREANRTTLEEMRALTRELRTAIRENRPGPGGVEIPDEVIEMRGDLREQRKALAESRRAVVEALGEDPTDEEIRTAIEQWREDNADAIAETRALAKEIRTWFRENRPERPGDGPPAHILQRRAAFKDNARDIRQNRRQMAAALRNAETEEDRKQIVQEFREEQRQLIRERKELKRQQRQDQVGAGGDRRPGG